MKHAKRSFAAIAVASTIAISGAAAFAASSDTGNTVIRELGAGGYVIYLRHSITDTTRSDSDPIDIKDCSTQRPLSGAGRELARKIGEGFRSARIPVDCIVSSPYCRAVETAALEFPGLPRTTSNALWYSLALPKDQAERAAVEVKTMLATSPQTGANTVIVGHTSNLQEAAGFWPKKEGGAAVFRPDGHGAFTLVGWIDPADLATAAE